MLDMKGGTIPKYLILITFPFNNQTKPMPCGNSWAYGSILSGLMYTLDRTKIMRYF